MRRLSLRCPMMLLIAASLWSQSGCALVSNNKPDAGDGVMSDRKLSMARLSERQGNIREAQMMYEVLVEEDPQNKNVHHRLAVVAARQQKFEQASHHFNMAQQLGPVTAELLTDLGFALYLQNDLQTAEEKLRGALEIDPYFKPAHNNLAIVLGHQQRYDESLSHFRVAMPEAQALANLAYVQTQMGDLAESERSYHIALEHDNKLRPAAEALIQVASRTRGLRVTDPPSVSLVNWQAAPDEKSGKLMPLKQVEHHADPLERQ